MDHSYNEVGELHWNVTGLFTKLDSHGSIFRMNLATVIFFPINNVLIGYCLNFPKMVSHLMSLNTTEEMKFTILK